MAKQKYNKNEDLTGKILVCRGRKPKEPENVALRWVHSDPSRRSVEHIDITRGMRLRVPQDISEVDARLLLKLDEWHFRVEDQPQESEEPKGDK